jgi:hypothetical protein
LGGFPYCITPIKAKDIIMSQDRIKVVVFKEHTIGFIFPEMPNSVSVLHSSLLKGAPFELWPACKVINKPEEVRLASNKDLEDFMIAPGQYDDETQYQMAV